MSPIQKHKSWKFLLRDVIGQNRRLASLTQQALEIGLVMPVAVARWILARHEDLLSKDSLHIVIAGSEWGPDHADEGRWYQFIPYLLGKPSLKVRMSIIGPDVYTTTRTGAPDGLSPTMHQKPLKLDTVGALSAFPPAAIERATVGEFVRQHADEIDAVLLSHPGMESYSDSWLRRDELGAVLDLKIPVGVASYAQDEYDHEVYILHVHGYAASGWKDVNPFSFVEPHAVISSASAAIIWDLEPQGPSEHFVADQGALDQLREYQAWASNCLKHGVRSISMAGEFIEDFAAEDGKAMFVPPCNAVSLVDGEVLEFSDDGGGGAFEIGITLPEKVVERYRTEPEFAFERQLRALEAFNLIQAALMKLNES